MQQGVNVSFLELSESVRHCVDWFSAVHVAGDDVVAGDLTSREKLLLFCSNRLPDNCIVAKYSMHK